MHTAVKVVNDYYGWDFNKAVEIKTRWFVFHGIFRKRFMIEQVIQKRKRVQKIKFYKRDKKLILGNVRCYDY